MILSEIIQYIKSGKNKAEKIKRLKEHDAPEIRILLKGSYDPKIKWLPGLNDIKYKKSRKNSSENSIYDISKILYNYIDNNNNLIKLEERKKSFKNILESLNKDEALFLLSVVNKSVNKDYKISIPIVKSGLNWNDNYSKRE